MDEEIAELLNQYFVAIKVDKEERPDIDAVYMEVCQMMTNSGGWPLTIIMSPDQIPFFAATYIPKRSRYSMIGLIELLAAVYDQWLNNRSKILESSKAIYHHLLSSNKYQNSGEEPTMEMLHLGIKQLKEGFDAEFGGFHKPPKFPRPHDLLFLIEYGSVQGDVEAITMAQKTLQQMYRGGIFDHIGGGFSRYSTDRQWLIPHFEKMLYDNALLTFVYAKAYEITGESLYAMIAKRTIAYAENELRGEDGGFYCGQDADSDGEEGKYYALIAGEIREQLGDGALKFCDWFGFTESGNFEGKNIPNLIKNLEYQTPPKEMEEWIPKIYQYRRTRTMLHTDDKVLASWNGMMIAALARAARAFEKTAYLDMAKASCAFIENHLKNSNGRLLKRWRNGEAAGLGQLDDYAYYAWALLEVYETCGEVIYLERALRYGKEMLDLFWDEENDGFFLYSHDAEQLIIRPKEVYDGAVPSGNSVAALVLYKLFRITAVNRWQEYSGRQLAFLAGEMGAYPISFSFALNAFMQVLRPGADLICVAEDITDMSAVRGFMKEQKIMNATIIIKTRTQMERLEHLAPFTKEYPIPEQGVAYYICENGTCHAPIFR